MLALRPTSTFARAIEDGRGLHGVLVHVRSLPIPPSHWLRFDVGNLVGWHDGSDVDLRKTQAVRDMTAKRLDHVSVVYDRAAPRRSVAAVGR
jgi:hypothetical protein